VIEHLPLPQQLTLIEQARRVLAPGGLLILETPNPENLFVGACWFHYDPTHRAPLPPDLLQFMVDRAGFVSSRILRMNDAPQQQHLPNLEIEAIRVLNHHLFGGRDYAVLAARPATA
jgi:O-antigen chain-terminating methyltransferase